MKHKQGTREVFQENPPGAEAQALDGAWLALSLSDLMTLPSFSAPLICQVQKIIPLCQLSQGMREDSAHENNQTMTSPMTEEAVFIHAHPWQDKSGLRIGTRTYSCKGGCFNREDIVTTSIDRALQVARVCQRRHFLLCTLPNHSRWLSLHLFSDEPSEMQRA